jgi:CRP-like cAMP-binding protein
VFDGMPSFSDSDRFSRLDARERDRLESLAKLDRFDRGQQILGGGQKSDSLALIVKGTVELRAHRAQGDDVVLATLGPGDLYGEVETFADLPDGVRHVARDETFVRAIAKDPLRHELRAHPPLAAGLLFAYCRSISEKIRPATKAASEVAPDAPSVSRPPPPRASHVSEEEAKWLAILGERVEPVVGSRVVVEGEKTRAFYLLERGACEVRKSSAGGERMLAVLGPGDLFGIMAFVDGKPRSASVVMTDVGSCIKVEPDALERAARMNFTVSFKFLGTLCGVMARMLCETARQVAQS